MCSISRGLRASLRVSPVQGPQLRDESVRHLAAMRDALEAVHRNHVPDPSCVALPSGLDRSVLGILPFRVRTWNCLAAAGLFADDDPLTVRNLLNLRNFGRLSLRDLLLVVENFLKERIRSDPVDPPHECSEDSTALASMPHSSVSATRDTYIPEDRDRIGTILAPLLTAAAEFQSAVTLADIFTPETIRLVSTLDPSNKIMEVRIDDLVDKSTRLSSILSSHATQIYATLSLAQRTVVDLRLLASPRKTLSEVSKVLGVTPERVRQIHAKIETRIDTEIGFELQTIATVLKTQLGPVVRECAVDARIDDLLLDTVTPGIALARYAIRAKIGYSLVVNGVCLDGAATQVLEHIQAIAPACADDTGIIDQVGLIDSLPGEDWHAYWPLLLECCSFHDLFGLLVLRDSEKARIKAALLSIGSTVTREELAALCGVSPARAGAVLSNLTGVVRADKSSWGLSEWIDDEYDGVVGEIIQRINEDGGITTTDRLFDEIPRKFKVSRSSIHTYLQTPKFTVRDGHVSLADASSVQLRDLDDVIDGRDERGAPYWTFVVQVRYLEGHSVNGVPPEFAKHAGCTVDGTVRLSIAKPIGCRDLSVRWRLASTSGATIGYVADPLQCLGVQPGDRVRVTIPGAGTAELSTELATRRPSIDSAHSVLTRIKNRRRVL